MIQAPPSVNSIRRHPASSTPPEPQPARGGVFPIDIKAPIPSMEDPVAREVLDDDGNTIGYCVIPRRLADNQRFLESAWGWYDEFGITDRQRASAAPYLQRVK